MNKFIMELLVILFSNLTFGQDASSKGLEIAKAAELADVGFGSSTAELKMILRNKNGQTSERFLWHLLPVMLPSRARRYFLQ